MKQALSIEDVIEKEFYVDRHGASHPNKNEGKSVYFSNRVEDLFLDVVEEHYDIKIDHVEFLQVYETLNELIIALPRVISKDSFRKNWVWGRRGNIISIDFGTLRWLPAQFELVNLFEGCRDNLGERDITRLVKEYVNIRNRDSGKSINYDGFQRDYFVCAVQRHLELVGYNELGYLDPPAGISHRREENTWQIQKAKHNLGETRNYHPRIDVYCRFLDEHLTRLERKILG